MSDAPHSTGDDESDIPPAPFPPPLGREKPLRPAGTQPTGTSWEPDEAPLPPPQSAREPKAASTTPPDIPPPPAPEAPTAPEPTVFDSGAHAGPPPPPARPVTAIPAQGATPPPSERYPVHYDVLYPGKMSRWSTFFRGLLFIPIWLFLTILTYAMYGLFVVGWTAVFWRKKYPLWAFHGLAGALGFVARATTYALLQTDHYPSFDKEQSLVSLEFDDPPSGYLSRWRVFWWKLFLLVPHFVVLGVLRLALTVVTILAWFAILVTGEYPRGMFAFTNGVMRWHFRVTAYFASFNDRFPPYALSEEAGPAGRTSTRLSAIGGVAIAGMYASFVVLVAVLAIRNSGGHTETLSYAALKDGRAPNVVAFHNTVDDSVTEVLLRLVQAHDPGGDLVKLIEPPAGTRVIVFEWGVTNLSGSGQSIASHPATLKAAAGGRTYDYEPAFVTVDGHAPPYSIPARRQAKAQAVFLVPIAQTPVELDFEGNFGHRNGVTYKFTP